MPEILDYSLDKNNCVADFGKFEGEPAYVPFLWDYYLNGFEDKSLYCGSDHYSIYFVDNDMRAKFPDLLGLGDFAVVLWETNEGFVNSECFTKGEYNKFLSDCESENVEESE